MSTRPDGTHRRDSDSTTDIPADRGHLDRADLQADRGHLDRTNRTDLSGDRGHLDRTDLPANRGNLDDSNRADPTDRAHLDRGDLRTDREHLDRPHHGDVHGDPGHGSAVDRDRLDHTDHTDHRPEPVAGLDRRQITARQQERFGGIKWGSAFFGWLTAIGTAVLLTALVVAIGASFNLSWAGGSLQAEQAARNPDTLQTATVTGAIISAVLLLVAFYCGGYVAGRMARFNGMKQGIAVWLWTILIGAVVAIAVAVSDSTFTVPDGVPTLPINQDTLTTAGVVAALVALAVGLVGAILGGLAGMHFHRKIDNASLDTDD